MTPKQLTIQSCGEIIINLDPTTTIWRCEFGYYWYEKFAGIVSTEFFKTEQQAIKDFQQNMGQFEIPENF